MRLVTYAAGDTARVGVLDGEEVIDAGFDGDMVAYIEAGAPQGAAARVEPRPRLLAPLRPRSLRDFLGFEGHLKGAYAGLGRDIPQEWYEVPAYYKGMPDTVIGPDTEIRVWDSSGHSRWFVVPERPAGTEGMSEEELAQLVTTEAMIGVALAKSPAES